MEAVGAAASILAIAGVGIQISLKLIAFADQVSTSPEKIQDVGIDVSITAGALYELGALMHQKKSRKRAVEMFRPDQIENIMASSTICREVFEELKEILTKASQQLREIHESATKSQNVSTKIELSRIERMRWPFLQPSTESLRITLDDAKGTLTLILQVVHLRHAHITASLNEEEQNDLIRTIAAMQRQQIASESGSGGPRRDPGADESEGSDAKDPPEVRMVLEAWSVIPNTFDERTQSLLITPIPVSQEQLEKELNTSPQDFAEIASMVDTLSLPERDAILERVLGNSRSHPNGSVIRSISSQIWTGSHHLFGKVTSRKFKLIIERWIGESISPKSNRKHRASQGIDSHRHKIHDRRDLDPDSEPPRHDSFSNSESDYETEAYTHRSNPSLAGVKGRRRRRPAQASPMPSLERRRPLKDDDWEQEQKADEKRDNKYKKASKAKVKKGAKRRPYRRGDPHIQPQTDSQPASDIPDDHLVVGSLLAHYTNFEFGEPLVQWIPKLTPTYDEPSVIPKRTPRPY